MDSFCPVVKSPLKAGFTLIELSIVLVIIGLIVGGVLVGQDLINAAGIRAQISQIEKYQAAVNTFRGKYGYLPGDIPNPAATQYGFGGGAGDGNGVLTAGANVPPGNILSSWGELGVFWIHLGQANLIDGAFNTATSSIPCNQACTISGAQIALYFPHAKIGQGNYIYVWSGGPRSNGLDGIGDGTAFTSPDGYNYFGLSAVTSIAAVDAGEVVGSAALTVTQAYNIDKKMDDGYPQSGVVMAVAIGTSGEAVPSIYWSTGLAAGDTQGANNNMSPVTTPTPWVAYNCYDNNNSNGPQTYSMALNANVQNCALSFRFQ